jgi:hypothetical protein
VSHPSLMLRGEGKSIGERMRPRVGCGARAQSGGTGQ